MASLFYDSLVYCLISEGWLRPSALFNRTNTIHMTISVILYYYYKYIMYNVQDYSVLYNNAVHLVIYEGWHFAHAWKTLA